MTPDPRAGYAADVKICWLSEIGEGSEWFRGGDTGKGESDSDQPKTGSSSCMLIPHRAGMGVCVQGQVSKVRHLGEMVRAEMNCTSKAYLRLSMAPTDDA